MAHSAYPHLGESAINKLLDALVKIRQIEMPERSMLGPSSLNIGMIKGGRASNVIPDDARAEIFFRLGRLRRIAACPQRLQAVKAARPKRSMCGAIPAVHLETLDGFETAVMAYTTDIPAFQGAWGKPLLDRTRQHPRRAHRQGKYP